VSLIPELPLLRRELTELANRRRTYVVRVVGAVILLFFVFLAYSKSMSMRQQVMNTAGVSGTMRYMGIGGDIFSEIIPLLFYTIQVLMPALCCACVTTEKENNTLGTLMLTRLSSGTIILEKFGSRLVPMLTLLLLTFPVLAHVHTLGGVDTDLLIATLWLLFCECLLFASIAIACSTWFTTTVAAFVWSYALIGVLAALSLSLGYATFVPSAIWRSEFTESLWGISRTQMAGFNAAGVPVAQSHWLLTVSKSVPAMLVTAAFLLFARLALVRRAFVSQASVLLKVFRMIDVFFTALNERTTGGIELVRDSNPLPGDDPVTWRERNKKSLGKARYLFRVLVVLEIPTLFICVLAATASARNYFYGLYVLQGLIWTLTVLVTAVKASTLFSSERANQTIEPLLATPMSGVELLSQKVVGMRRLLIVLSVPILTVNVTHFLLQVNFSSLSAIVVQRPGVYLYLLLSICTAYVLLSLVTWLSVGIGLMIHSQTRAVLVSGTVLATWTVVPLIIVQLFRLAPPLQELVTTFSPYSAVAATEQYLINPIALTGYNAQGEQIEYVPRLLWAGCAIAFFWAVMLAIRHGVRSRCPFLLNRGENPSEALPTSGMHRIQVPVLEGTQ
jgi:ABC-type transport system involved in multi-copper enzyme maturation permease subunit